MSDTYAILTLQRPEQIVTRYRPQHVGEMQGETRPHVEWLWKLKPAYRTSAITKLTENGQLHIIFDRPRVEVEPFEIVCEPTHRSHVGTNTVRVGADGRVDVLGPPTDAQEHELLDKSDVLVLADPRTYDERVPKKR